MPFTSSATEAGELYDAAVPNPLEKEGAPLPEKVVVTNDNKSSLRSLWEKSGM